MLSKEKSDHYLFQIIFIYRRTIPSNELFYFIFFFFKFIGAFLLVHNIKGQEDDVYSFESILHHLTLMANNIGFILEYYTYVSIIILVFLVLMLLLAFIIIISQKKTKSKINLLLLKHNTTNLTLPTKMRKTIKTFSIIFLIIVFLSHFISEFLLFSLMPLLYAKSGQDMNAINQKGFDLKKFIIKVQTNKYAIFFINCISIIIIIGFNAIFLLISSSTSLEKKYGLNTHLGMIGVVLLLICFQFQGVYTISCYFFESEGENIKFRLCCITFIIILICFLWNLKQYNHSKDKIAYFINFIINWCLIGAIVEIILSQTLNDKLTQMESLSKTVFEIINAVFFTILVTRIKLNIQLRNFVHNAFNAHNKVQEYHLIEEYAFILSNHLYHKIDFIQMYQLFEDHRTNCPNEQCKCHKLYSQLQKKIKSKKNIIKTIKSVFIGIGEKEIVALINLSKEQTIKSKTLRKLYFLHVDYVKTIKGKYFLALYLAKWYQQYKATLFDYYLLYEIEEDIIEMFNDRREINHTHQSEEKKLNDYKLSIKNRYKQKILMCNSLFSEKLMLQIYNCLNEMERFAYYRNLVRMNVKTAIKCEEFLKPITMFIKEYKEMNRTLNDYFNYNKVIPSEFIELSYVLNYFFILFNGEVPTVYNGKFTHFSKYTDYVLDTTITMKYMILLLRNDDTIQIKALSIQLAEDLSFTKEELINNDIHDLLIPNHLAQHHLVYMKSYILNGESTFKKVTYMINKDKCIIPYKLLGKILPSINKDLCLIIRVKGYAYPTIQKKSKDEVKESTYYLCLDYYYNLLAVSENFTQHFVFTLKMFNDLQLNFCSFFGIKQEQVTNYFNRKLNKKSNMKGKELRNSILTTIPHEKKQLYQNVLNYYRKRKDCEEKEVQVHKSRAVSFIKRIEKSINELGLEKEWIERINDLCARLGCNQSQTSLDITEMHSSCFQDKNNNKFSFLFKLRNIGNLYYYIVIFQNKTPESVLFKPQQEDLILKENNLNTSLSLHKTYGSNIDDKQTYLNINATSKESSYFELNSKNDLNQSSNNNSKALILNNKAFNPNLDIGLFKNTFQDSTFAYRKIILIKKKANILQKIQLFFLVVLILFNIVTFTVNNSFVSVFVNMFSINSYAFLLSGDIFLTSLGCLRACLIQENLQAGSIKEFEETIVYHANEMIEHFQSMQKLIHQIAKGNEAEVIYKILTEETEYHSLLSNWEKTTRVSSFREEIFYYHYYLSNFDISAHKSCKLKVFFSQSEEFRNTTEATNEEKIIYYIIINIISKISVSLHQLTQITNKQLNSYSQNSERYLISFNIIILILGVTLYLSLMGYIILLKQINEVIMTQFFSKMKGEDDFNADVERLKRVLMHFNKKECKQFEETKGKSNPFLLKSKEVTPYYSTNIKSVTSNSNNHTSSVSINQTSKLKINHNTKQNRLKIADQKYQKKNIQFDTELVEQYRITIQKLSKMRFMKTLMFSIGLLFFIFSGIQISNLLIIINDSHSRITENIVSTYFLLRIPKFAELVLYTEISVITNSLDLVIPNKTNNELENYYSIIVNDNDGNFINSLSNKNFVYLYNQLYIIRQNLHYFINDKTTNQMFPLVQNIELQFQSKEFCIEVSRVYTLSLYDKKVISAIYYFKEVSNEGRKCRVFGSGINMSGLKVVLDLLIQHLYVLYVEFETKPRNEATQKEFLEDDLLELISDSLQSTMGNVHKSFAYFTLTDVNDSYKSRYKVEIIISIVSMIVSTGVFILLLTVIIKSFEKHNSILEDFLVKMDKAVRLKQMNRGNIDFKGLR